MECFQCAGRGNEAQITTVVSKQLLQNSTTINMQELLKHPYFLAFSKSQVGGVAQYTYVVKSESGGLEWKVMDGTDPTQLLLKMKPKLADADAEDPLALNVEEESLANHLLSMDDMVASRDFLKVSTQNIAVGLVLALSAKDLNSYTERTRGGEVDESQFACTSTMATFGEAPALKEFGIFLSTKTRNGATLSYAPVTRTLEHVNGQCRRNRVLVNRTGDAAFAFDREQNTWSLQKGNALVDDKQLEAFATDGFAWTNATDGDDEVTTTVNASDASAMPVLICDAVKSQFVTADHLEAEKKDELIEISKNNRVYRMDSFTTKAQSLFKHAVSVTIFALSARETSLDTVYKSVNNADRTTDSAKCAAWLRFADA